MPKVTPGYGTALDCSKMMSQNEATFVITEIIRIFRYQARFDYSQHHQHLVSKYSFNIKLMYYFSSK